MVGTQQSLLIIRTDQASVHPSLKKSDALLDKDQLWSFLLSLCEDFRSVSWTVRSTLLDDNAIKYKIGL